VSAGALEGLSRAEGIAALLDEIFQSL
jgi:hypothetical protein